MFENEKGQFCPDKFIEYVHVEGRKIICDGSQEYFNKSPEVPPFYDETRFKRAQEFFHNNVSSMMTVSMAGLITLLSDPSNGVQILIATNKSSEPVSAYKRYRDTMLYMMTWYDGKFCPGSESWKTVLKIRQMHNAASVKAHNLGLMRIDQYMMSFTIFGFMGFALARQQEVGLGLATDEELDALVHFWRVIGFVMGLDDRFSLCRESLEETRAICTRIVDCYLSEKIALKHPDSLMLQFAVLDGMNIVMPTVDSKVHMNFFYGLIHPKSEENKHIFYDLGMKEEMQLKFFTTIPKMFKYPIVKKYMNSKLLYTLNLLKKYPEIMEYTLDGSPMNIIFI